jgi:hypothetical protein
MMKEQLGSAVYKKAGGGSGRGGRGGSGRGGRAGRGTSSGRAGTSSSKAGATGSKKAAAGPSAVKSPVGRATASSNARASSTDLTSTRRAHGNPIVVLFVCNKLILYSVQSL